MTTNKPKSVKNMTYEESLQALVALGVSPFRVSGTLWGRQIESVLFNTREEACTYLNKEIDKIREEFEEEVENGILVDTCSPEEGDKKWTLSVWCDFPSEPGMDRLAHTRKPEFIRGCRFGAERLANPNSKVFVWIGGRDCDNANYGGVYEFNELWDASDYVTESGQSSDGREGYSVITRHDFETFIYGE